MFSPKLFLVAAGRWARFGSHRTIDHREVSDELLRPHASAQPGGVHGKVEKGVQEFSIPIVACFGGEGVGFGFRSGVNSGKRL